MPFGGERRFTEKRLCFRFVSVHYFKSYLNIIELDLNIIDIMIGRPNIADFVFFHQESPPESAARESSEIKRKKRRQYEEKCEKMRASKLAATEKRCKASVSSPTRPILRSDPPYKKIGNASREYIFNLEMLMEALEKCQYCDKGPLGLANTCQDVRPEGPIPILKVKCSNCCSVNSIRPAESHRTGKRGQRLLT